MPAPGHRVGRRLPAALRGDRRHPYQWLADAPEVRTVDLRAEPDPAAACRRWIRDSFDRPFDLRGGRTSGLTLLLESDSVVYAHVKAHHIVADAWGLNLLMSRVRADYEHVLRTGSPCRPGHRGTSTS
ncbi:condensation domain-containing protein [Streptomyces stramineus]